LTVILNVELLLALAEQIQPEKYEDESERISLLSVKSDDSIDEIYRVNFDDVKPVLLITSRVGDWRTFAREPVFIAIAYPADFA
jgi:hypothetical protein